MIAVTSWSPADLLDNGRVVDVTLDQRRAEDGLGATELQRVQDDDVAPGLAQCPYRVGPDVPGTAGDQDRHRGAASFGHARGC